MQPFPWALLSVYAGHKSFLDLPKAGVHKTWHSCACSYLEHKPQEERLQQPLPFKGCHGLVWERLWSCCAGEQAGSWQLPWPWGIRDSPPPQLTRWHTLQPGPRSSFLFPACPGLSQALITAAGGLGSGPSAHITQEPWDAGGLSVPSVPLSRPLFSRASPAPAISGWSLDPSGEKPLLFVNQEFQYPHFPRLWTLFFQTPFSITCLPLAEAQIPLFGVHQHIHKDQAGRDALHDGVRDGDMSFRPTALSSSSLLICQHAAHWFHLLIPI